MKRKYITLLSLSIMLVCQTSCSDFFDQMPTDRLTYNDLFESKASTEKALATVYVYLPDEFAQRLAADGRHTTPGIWTAGCDEAEYYWDFVPSHLVNNNTITPKSSIVSSYWEKYYAGISAAGRFIQGAPQCKDMEQNLLAQWIEEARALRAMYYFYLLRIYGPIPILSDDPISMDAPLEKVQLPRNSVEECVEYIVSEFDKVLDSGCLPEKSLTYNCGRIDNSIVMAFKAEVLQYAASDLYNGKNSFVAQLRNKDGKKLFPEDISDEAVKAKWRRAATASKAFIDRFVPGNYDLTKVYTNGVLNAYLSCRDAVRGEDFTNT